MHVLIEGLPEGCRTFGDGGWLIEHELLASLLEVTVNRGLKKSKRIRIPRPERDVHARAKSKAEVVDKMLSFAKRIGPKR